jgi:hypothetical protein
MTTKHVWLISLVLLGGIALAFLLLPRAPWTFALDSLGSQSDGAMSAFLAMDDCFIDVRILDSGRNVLREVSDPVSTWHCSQSAGRCLLWHEQLRDLQFDSREEYTVMIHVKCLEPSTGTIVVEPQLTGGGNELP